MTPRPLQGGRVLVVGAGIMGTGIAEVAAQAGHAVRLFDARPGAAQQAVARLGATLEGLAADAAEAALSRIAHHPGERYRVSSRLRRAADAA